MTSVTSVVNRLSPGCDADDRLRGRRLLGRGRRGGPGEQTCREKRCEKGGDAVLHGLPPSLLDRDLDETYTNYVLRTQTRDRRPPRRTIRRPWPDVILVDPEG